MSCTHCLRVGIDHAAGRGLLYARNVCDHAYYLRVHPITNTRAPNAQSIGLINDVPTCAQVIQNIMTEYDMAVRRVGAFGRPVSKL